LRQLISLILKRHFERKKSEFLFEFVAAIGTRRISSQPRIDAIDVEVVFAWQCSNLNIFYSLRTFQMLHLLDIIGSYYNLCIQ